MDFRDKKMAVLHRLSQESETISLLELLKKLGEEFAERSVRRWLMEMIKEGLVEKIGSKRATKYRATTRAQSRRIDTRSCFSSDSLKVLIQVRKPLFERNPSDYSEEWFDSYKPNATFYIPLSFRTQLHQAGKRSKQHDPAGTYAHQIFDRLLIDLSYNSSRLEGNSYSLLDTQRLILEGKGAEGKLYEDKVMILNHKEAIHYLVDNAPRLKISTRTIYTLHYLLSDGLVEAEHSGKVRDHTIRIGGSTYIPFEDPKRLRFQLERITEKASLINDPYEQSLFLLVHISYLQAFSDVNKRTARLSANLPLITHNFVPLSFNDVERNDYISAIIAIYELQNVQPLVDLYIYSYMRTCAMYDSTIKAIGFDEVRVRYRQERRAIIRNIILHQLTDDGMKDYIDSQTKKLIPENDREAFIADIMEDLHMMNGNRIAGLGITLDQLADWSKKTGFAEREE